MARNLIAFAGFVVLLALIVWALEGCGVRTYEQKMLACRIDAGTWAQVEDCQQSVECEYRTRACGLRWR